MLDHVFGEVYGRSACPHWSLREVRTPIWSVSALSFPSRLARFRPRIDYVVWTIEACNITVPVAVNAAALPPVEGAAFGSEIVSVRGVRIRRQAGTGREEGHKGKPELNLQRDGAACRRKKLAVAEQ